MDKMRVKLATQVFSKSMADGLTYYNEIKVNSLWNCAGTIEFTLRLNDLFDALNRRYPNEGIRHESSDLKMLARGIDLLNSWECELQNGTISNDMFLTHSTAQGLRVTLQSTIDLSVHLLTKCSFNYVLSCKFNQDPIERFFGKVRQAAGENDHPDMPTFLQLYRTLTLYSLLKPPKFGNCEVQENETSLLDFAAFKDVFQGKTMDTYKEHLDELRRKMDGLIETEEWECEDVLCTDDTIPEVADCIVYYVTGFLSRKVKTMFSCSVCRDSLSVRANSGNEAALTNSKTQGGLVHPNSNLFKIVRVAEDYFSKHCDDHDVFWNTTDHVIAYGDMSFPCNDHKTDAMARILHYYVLMRMRQCCKAKNRDAEKQCREKKKESRLCNT